MATIDVRRPHALPLDEAKKRAEDLARTLEQRFGLTWQWDGDAIQFDAKSGAAKGTKGRVSVSLADVRVEVDLPFMLRVMKSSIESKVREKLDTALRGS